MGDFEWVYETAIGLGKMGGGMAARLVGAGQEVIAYDLSAEALARAAGRGCTPAASVREAVAGAGGLGEDRDGALGCSRGRRFETAGGWARQRRLGPPQAWRWRRSTVGGSAATSGWASGLTWLSPLGR